jgi:LemA protein
MKYLIGFVAVISLVMFVLGSYLMGTYNSLVEISAQADEASSNVETQYQRRFDLIPGLVGATKGVLAQEQKVFGDIAEARTKYAGAPSGSSEKLEATQGLDAALARLMVIVENYPQLKSNETVRDLMYELSGTENRVSVARTRYNEIIKLYNSKIKQFPTILLAGLFGFEVRPFFEAAENADKAVEVDLSLD